MAFRAKKSYPRSSGRSFLTKKAASRSYAKKKTQWVTLYNKVCGVDTHATAECSDDEPSASLTLPLFKPTPAIAGGFDYSALGDSIRVVKIVGQLFFGFIASDQDRYSGLGTFRMGLKETEYSFSDAIFPTFNPLEGDPDTDGDYSEARWIWLKERYIGSAVTRNILPPTVVWRPEFKVCETGLPTDVTACVEVSNINDGTGHTWQVNDTDDVGIHLGGECVTCDEVGNQSSISQPGAFPVWRMSVNHRRPLLMKDNRMLTLTIAFQDNSNPTQDGTLYFFGGIRALVEV